MPLFSEITNSFHVPGKFLLFFLMIEYYQRCQYRLILYMSSCIMLLYWSMLVSNVAYNNFVQFKLSWGISLIDSLFEQCKGLFVIWSYTITQIIRLFCKCTSWYTRFWQIWRRLEIMLLCTKSIRVILEGAPNRGWWGGCNPPPPDFWKGGWAHVNPPWFWDEKKICLHKIG